MNRQKPKDIAASIRARLLARSRETGEDFQFLLQRYASERFLYRLGESPHRDRYVLKGAMLFALWGGSLYRATRDLDFTGYGNSETDAVIAAMREICTLPVANDGLTYDAATVMAEPIRETAEYNGLRVRLSATLAGARIPMQIDIGFGNAVEPPATEAEYPTLLGLPAPRIRAYPHEAVVAEKFHAMAVLGEINSRYKDFYDIYVLASRFGFDGERVARAIAATFDRRRTPIDAAFPAALTPRFFAEDRRDDKAVTHAVLKTIAAFLNTEGGDLLIGVADDGSLVGIERDQLDNDDKFMRHLTQVVRNGMGDRAGTCIDPKAQIVQGKTVCVVSCQRSPEPVFLKWKGIEAIPEGDFFVRHGPGTVKLSPDSTKEYIRTRFGL